VFVIRSLADHVSAPETLRRLVHAILEHQHENLQDDATAVLIERETCCPKWPPARLGGHRRRVRYLPGNGVSVERRHGIEDAPPGVVVSAGD
jgi:hypothetical protein